MLGDSKPIHFSFCAMTTHEVLRANEAAIYCGCFSGVDARNNSPADQPECGSVSDLMSHIARCDWESVLADSASRQVLDRVLHMHRFDISSSAGCFGYPENIRLLLVAVGSLQAFEQLNYTGPSNVTDQSFGINQAMGEAAVESLNDFAREFLNIDGEVIYERTVNPFLLALSESILLSSCGQASRSSWHFTDGETGRGPMKEMGDASSVPEGCETWLLWTLRSLMIHQQVLGEKCQTLKDRVKDVLKAVECSPSLQLLLDPPAQQFSPHSIAAQFYLEAFRACSCYYIHEGVDSNLEKACRSAGITIQYIGIKGKRTRYQEKEVSQLSIDVQQLYQSKQLGHCTTIPASHLPQDVALNDDTLYEKVVISPTERWTVADLTIEQQAAILATCENNMIVKAEAADIVNEETLAYLSYLLAKPRSWCIQAKSLAMRSATESDSSRRAERSLHQLEVLARLCQDTEPPAATRLAHLSCAGYLPAWKMEQRLADYQVKIGAYGSALEVYEKLGFWEDVVNCCHRIGRRQKAEGVVREQLKIKETPLLYCCLADATDNLEYYHKAWEISNHKFARAARGLGFAYLRQGEFLDAVKFFELGLEINSLHVGAWFSCGCAAMAAGEYQKAARSFQRCVSIDSDNFEAWNNLAAAYIRSQQKTRALAVLEDALKCNYENWRVWENYLVVATDCGAFDAVIRAAHRLLDLREKWNDPQVIVILCRAVLENCNDICGKPAQNYKSDLLQLLGRLTAKVTPDGDTWCMYARLLLTGSEKDMPENVDRALQYLHKCYRCITTNSDWDKDVGKCKTVAQQIVDLATAYMDAYEVQRKAQLLSSVRLQLKGTITRIRQRHTDPITGMLNSELVEPVAAVESALATVMAKAEASHAACG